MLTYVYTCVHLDIIRKDDNAACLLPLTVIATYVGNKIEHFNFKKGVTLNKRIRVKKKMQDTRTHRLNFKDFTATSNI